MGLAQISRKKRRGFWSLQQVTGASRSISRAQGGKHDPHLKTVTFW
jgi:hypothetical protein